MQNFIVKMILDLCTFIDIILHFNRIFSAQRETVLFIETEPRKIHLPKLYI